MIHNSTVFIAALLIRFVIIVPALSFIPIMGIFKKETLLRHFSVILCSVILVTMFGTTIISSPLYLAAQPPNSGINFIFVLNYIAGEFSLARVAGLWISLVILPVHHIHAVMICLGVIFFYIVTVAATTNPWQWVAFNISAMIGVSLAGLFTTYNRDVSEYLFFRALSDGVRKVDGSEVSVSGFTQLTAGVTTSTHRNREATVHPLILQSLHNSIQKEMEKSEVEEDVGREATRINLMLCGFHECVRMRLFIFKEFKDIMAERSFRAYFSTRGVSLRAVRASISLTAGLLILLSVSEFILFRDSRHLNLLIILRFAITVPTLLLLVIETFTPRHFIVSHHQLIVSIGLAIVEMFQAIRVYAVHDLCGELLLGSRVTDLYIRMYCLNVVRMLMYIVCGLPLRLPWALGTTISSWAVSVAIIVASTGLSLGAVWQHILFYPFLVVALGAWRSSLEDEKARVTYLLGELSVWSRKQGEKL